LAATSDPGIHERQAGVAPPGCAAAIGWLAPLADGEEPHWHVTFAVSDRDESELRAEELGAALVSGPTDDQWTRSAVVRDPQGAVFTLSQFDPQ
ncbi:MAG: VOC family protein, partial [Acidimicrobiales bacterium]